MAAKMVGGALLSATLKVVFDRLASREVVDYLRGNKLSGKLINDLKAVLLAVNAVLDDADEKRFTDPNINLWLDEVEAASYDADDLLDEIATQALQSKLEKASSSKKSRTSKFFNSVSSFGILYNRDMKNKLKEILRRFKVFKKNINFLGLTYKGVGETPSSRPSSRPSSESLIEEPEIYGRDGDKEAIIKLLLTDDHEGSNKVSVIPIVGMGGIGKTTLAQSVYNDHAVGKHFKLKSWVCVSDEFDICKVTKTVLCAVTNSLSHSYDNKDLDSLQTMLKEELVGKKFLIVLDDVWNENYVDWVNLSKPFEHGAQGSKILVTTRLANVAGIMGTVPPLYLEHLRDEDCWLLFAKHAFANEDCNAYTVLVTIGTKVVKKCRGLPLAAKTFGDLLHSNVDVADWERVSECEIWDLPSHKSNILPALMLSYHNLPSHLKRCFAFCSVFPKDYEFQSHQLVSLWMAENFLQQANINKRVEDVGNKYFNELVSRSFFQRSSQGEGYDRSSSRQESCFVMHDLVHDLAKFVSRGYCFTFENDNSNEDVMKVRHLAVAPDVSLQRFGSISTAIHLRTLLPLDTLSFFNLSNEVVNSVILKLRCLRILSLSGCENLEQLSELMGELKHLRFLDLSHTSIKILPNSVSKLYNLQTLNLSWCRKLIELPKDMYHLINLRHLDISGCYNLKEMPRQISDLKNLQRLSTFVVGEDNGTKIEELRELSDLHGELSLENLQNVASAADASEARLMDKKHLEGLHLFWRGYANVRIHHRKVAEKLLPHTNLKRLSIYGYEGPSFPNWLGDHSFCNIVSIKLENCKCNSLPPLGQLPSLKTLHIARLRGVVTVGAEFYGIIRGSSLKKPFASLEHLSFSNMSAWEEWSSIGVEDGEVFPMLQKLSIFNCERLGTVDWPDILPSLTELQIYGNEVLVSSLPRTPALRKLKLGVCENLLLEELPQTVESIHIEGNNDVESLIEAIRKGQTCFLKQPQRCPPASISPTSMELGDCPKLVSFPQGGLHAPNLKEFDIQDCEKLRSLPEHMNWSRSSHKGTNLEELHIEQYAYGAKSFPNLVSFPQGGLHAPNLECLDLHDCVNWKVLTHGAKSFPNWGGYGSYSCLVKVDLVCCKSCYCLPPLGQLPSLKKLHIQGFDRVERIGDEFYSTDTLSLSKPFKSLQSLTFSHMLWWKEWSFMKSGVFSDLKQLKLDNCRKLKGMCFPNYLPSLKSLLISGCKQELVASLSTDGLPLLSFLKIGQCKELESFPISALPANVDRVEIMGCKELVSLSEDGWPSKLKSLEISYCGKLFGNTMRWSLQTLTSLTSLQIIKIDEVVDSFPKEWQLPSTLKSLTLRHFRNLKSLNGKALQHHTSLKELKIEFCHHLQYLPEERLPGSLSLLEISGCGFLNRRCQKKRGEDWPKIAHIPHIRIDCKDI